jgi:putative DNA primase/helicase
MDTSHRMSVQDSRSADRLAKNLGWGRTDFGEGDSVHPELTDDGNAIRFVKAYGDMVRYCHTWKKWLIFDGKRWKSDEGGEIDRMARKVARSIRREAADPTDRTAKRDISKWARRSQSSGRITAMLRLARSDLSIKPAALDSDIWLLNCENGTVDLRTGKHREHRPEDYITKLCPDEFDPSAEAPRFERFLNELFDGDQGTIGFVRRYAGSCASGSTKDRAFAILWGAGKNGKTTLLELLRTVLGDYAKDTPVETVMQKDYEGVGNDVAKLKGSRLVTGSESEKGKKLAVAKVKKLVGSDTVSARFLYGEFFEFKPQMKLWIATNHKPVIEETADGIWDRVHLVPFRVRFEGDKAEEDLGEKLRTEAAGVLAWIVRGCLEWQRDGLNPPPAVLSATERYREESDPLGMFFEDCCVLAPQADASVSELRQAYVRWAKGVGEEAMNTKALRTELGDRGFEGFWYTSGPMKGRRGWRGIGLRYDNHPAGDRGSTDDSPDKPGNERYQMADKTNPAAMITPEEDLVKPGSQISIRSYGSVRIDIRRGGVK